VYDTDSGDAVGTIGAAAYPPTARGTMTRYRDAVNRSSQARQPVPADAVISVDIGANVAFQF
jgi:hypothetical protein